MVGVDRATGHTVGGDAVGGARWELFPRGTMVGNEEGHGETRGRDRVETVLRAEPQEKEQQVG